MLFISSNKEKYLHESREIPQYKLEINSVNNIHLISQNPIIVNRFHQYTVLFLAKGSFTYQNRTLYENSVIFIGKFQKIVINPTQNSQILSLEFEYNNPIPLFESNIFTGEPNSAFADLFYKLYSVKYDVTALEGTAEGVLLEILNLLNSQLIFKDKTCMLVNKVKNWILHNAHKNITVKQTAEELGYTTAHLNRVFFQETGETLSAFIAKARISKIKGQCSFAHTTTAEIAQTLNFDSPELLRKYFKYHTGTSLKDYIAKHRPLA